MVSLETGHSEAISAEAIPRHLRAILSCLALLVALNPHQLKMGYESGRMREVKFSSEKKASFAEPRAPCDTQSYNILRRDRELSFISVYLQLAINSPLIESPLADVAPDSYTSYIWLFTNIEHPAFPIGGLTPFSFSRYQRCLSQSTSSLRFLDVLLFFLVKFFITLSLFLFPFHCFQSRIPCPFDDQSLLRTSRSCISTSLVFLRPAGILLPALLPSGQPRSFYSFCNAPTIFLFLFPQAGQYFIVCLRRNIIIIPTFACTMSLYREGKHVI